MAVFKCKICGGNLDVQEGMSVCECEYCGTKQTLPKMQDQRRVNLYDRANHFRRNNEFDKAMSMYEQILEEDREDAEAYWSLVLCTYGIEYVEDPSDHTRKPTVNRTQYTSIYADENYKAALQYADEQQRQIYEEEAKQIDEIQKGILDISGKETPFDVFICYKETDAEGKRTKDSVLANDLYHQLTQEGFKVFFARITLEDKLGSAYEPYIFAALNSAKVMVVLGTRPEYFNAVWVRNEWSRYLSLIKGGAKKVLIPAYKDMDPYDLPQEFSHLQSQDMGKLGFMQDLIRGIRKLTGADQEKQTAAASGTSGNEASALLKRAFLFMEDGDFSKGDEYCERVLNLDPENGEAYLGKLMARLKVRKREDLAQNPDSLEQMDAYQKVMRFGSDAVKNELEGYNQQILKRLQEQQEKQREDSYQGALKMLETAVKSSQVQEGIKRLKNLGNYKDAAEKITAAAEKLAQLEKKEQEARKQQQRKATKIGTILAVATIVVAVIVFAAGKRNQYNQAVQAAESLLQAGNYDGAYRQFADLMDEKKAGEEVTKAMYEAALNAAETGDYRQAGDIWGHISEYTDDMTKMNQKLADAMYQAAQQHINVAEYGKVGEVFEGLNRAQYADEEADGQLVDALYQAAEQHVNAGEYDTAEEVFSVLYQYIQYRNTSYDELAAAIYRAETQCLKDGKYDNAEQMLSFLENVDNEYQKREMQLSFARAEIGDIVTFGRYDEFDGSNDVTWYVLSKKENGDVLLMSEYVLELWEDGKGCYSYDNCIGWENSSLRQWLNDTFFDLCFNQNEQFLIVESTLQNEQYSYIYNSEPDVTNYEQLRESIMETKDRVFVLSISELMSYIPTTRTRGFFPSNTFKGQWNPDYEFLANNIAIAREKTSGDAVSYYVRSSAVMNQGGGLLYAFAEYDEYIHSMRKYDKPFIENFYNATNSDMYIRPAIWVRTIEEETTE